MTTAAPVVLVLMASLANFLIFQYQDVVFRNMNSSEGFFSVAEVFSSDSEEGLTDNSSLSDVGFSKGQENISFVVVESSALLNLNNPLSNALPNRDGLMIYKVQKGDNLSKIAANFGISADTVFWANPGVKNNVSVGQEIVILPVNGVLHQVQSGETLESIARQYSVDPQKIADFNRGISGNTSVGSTIIVPGAKPIESSRLVSNLKLPDIPGYFAIPTTGWNWGRLHNYNAVDIANACGTPIYASAEGLVVEVSDDSWNEGYGRYLVIEHPNGTKTKYAHNKKNLVSIGDYVLKGDQIALIGNTGNTHGPTGCHLHFEIKGAKNPFAK